MPFLKKVRKERVINRLLKFFEKKYPYYQPEVDRYSDLGRSLRHYSTIHTWLVNSFRKEKLGKMAITHFGAGNGQYLDFLRYKYRMHTNAVEPNKAYNYQTRQRGLNPNILEQSAEKTTIQENSQDIVLSDHFLFSSYSGVNDQAGLNEARRILKKGGFLVLSEVYLTAKDFRKLTGSGWKRVYDNEKEFTKKETGRPHEKNETTLLVLQKI